MARGLFSRRGWKMGRSAHDHQSHRALGLASGSRALCVFRGALAGGGGRGRLRPRNRKLPERPSRSTNTPDTIRTTGKNWRIADPARSRRKPPPATRRPTPADDGDQSIRRCRHRWPTPMPKCSCPADTPMPRNAARAMTARANDILQAAPDKPADAQPAADEPTDARSFPPISSTTSTVRCARARRRRAHRPRPLAVAAGDAAPRRQRATKARPGTRPP